MIVLMIANREILDPTTVRTVSLQDTEMRFKEARAFAIACVERLGELYANLDPENEPDDAIRIAEMEGECVQANALYDRALIRYGWEMDQLRKQTS